MVLIINPITNKKKDISFFESFLDEHVLFQAEQLFDNDQIIIKESKGQHYELSCQDKDDTFGVKLDLRKEQILEYSCDCRDEDICAHIGASFFLVRRKINERSKVEKKKKPKINFRHFLEGIDYEELKEFIYNKARKDKALRTLVYSRFIIDKEGVGRIEEYIEKSFPPSNQPNSKPSQSEIRLFLEVVEELRDQTIDMVGRDNYFDAFQVLYPLVKRSFYFKSRFPDVPRRLMDTHANIVSLLKALHQVLEAPELRSEVQRKIAELLTLSYVQVNNYKEKELFLDLLSSIESRNITKGILNNMIPLNRDKNHDHFIEALKYVVNHLKYAVRNQSSMIPVFSEILSWHRQNPVYEDEIIMLAQRSDIPVRMKENVLGQLEKNENNRDLLGHIALDTLTNFHSYNGFLWLSRNDRPLWEKHREVILKDLMTKKRSNLVIKILITEGKSDQLFDYLRNYENIETYNKYIKKLITISEEDTFQLYCDWMLHYLSAHFGDVSKKVINQNLQYINSIDRKMKEKLERKIRKNFSERQSLNT